MFFDSSRPFDHLLSVLGLLLATTGLSKFPELERPGIVHWRFFNNYRSDATHCRGFPLPRITISYRLKCVWAFCVNLKHWLVPLRMTDPDFGNLLFMHVSKWPER